MIAKILQQQLAKVGGIGPGGTTTNATGSSANAGGEAGNENDENNNDNLELMETNDPNDFGGGMNVMIAQNHNNNMHNSAGRHHLSNVGSMSSELVEDEEQGIELCLSFFLICRCFCLCVWVRCEILSCDECVGIGETVKKKGVL